MIVKIFLICSVCFTRNLLDNHRDLTSDGEDEDEFVPSKKELQSSSEDEEEGDEEQRVDSDEEVVVKKGRRAAAGLRTPRSKQKTRTPRRTPSKVKSRQLRTSVQRVLSSSSDSFLPPQVAPSTPRTPRHATPSIPSRVLPTRQPANVLEEARTR